MQTSPRKLSALALAAAAALTVGCSDSPITGSTPKPIPSWKHGGIVAIAGDPSEGSGPVDLSPVTDPAHVGITEPTLVDVMLRQNALSYDVTVSEVIGPDGGTLSIQEAGLKLHVPKNAVSQPTTFTVTAVAGSLVAYEFAPHGATFTVPLVLEQKLKRTSAGGDLPVHFEAGHFQSRSALDAATEFATVSELLPALLDVGRSRIKFSVTHFSGYLLASGRRPGASTDGTD
jgi:hypothetical protein